jgi:hypothetical protein
MNGKNYIFLFLGAIAYGWLFAVLSKSNMPELTALITMLVATAPATASTLYLVKQTVQIANFNGEQIKEVTAVVFLCLTLGISAGYLINNFFPLRSPEIEYQSWRKLIDKDKSDYVVKNKYKVDSLVWDKLIGKYTKP